MNETRSSNITSERASGEVSGKTVGSILQERRIAAALSQEDVADSLKLSSRQIDAIERDRYESLPGNVFIRGFVRSYARLVGVEVEPLLDRLKDILSEECSQAVLPGLHEEKTKIYAGYYGRRERIKRVVFMMAVMLFLVAIVGTGMRYLMQQQYAKVGGDASMIVSSAPPIDENSVQNASNKASALLTDSSTAASRVSSTSEPISAKAMSGVVVTSDDAQAISTKTALQIHATQPSWAQVIDGNNEMLFRGIVKADTIENLGGRPPYHIRIGNVQCTTLIYNGKAIDLTPFSQRNVATLKVE